jgi:hypothetical protein
MEAGRADPETRGSDPETGAESGSGVKGRPVLRSRLLLPRQDVRNRKTREKTPAWNFIDPLPKTASKAAVFLRFLNTKGRKIIDPG